MKKSLFTLISLLCAMTFGLQQAIAIAICTSDYPSSPVGITPTLVAGNPALCTGGIRVDPPQSGTYALDAFGNTITVTISSSSCGQVFSWSASTGIVMDIVIAKGGPNANQYDYTGTNPRPTSDGNLHSPITSSGGYANLSHIDFCFHYKLDVEKTAAAKFKRTYDWSIAKTCDGPASLTLSTGQTYSYPFSWTVSVTGWTDSEWKVEGTITVANNTPFDATITNITDVLPGPITATPSCGVTFPYVLASGTTLNCLYSANLTGAVDGTNTVTVTTSTPLVEGNVATAPYAFGNPTSEVDECITVTDDCTSSATVCASVTGPIQNRSYQCLIGPYDVCGDYTYTNTASFTTNDQGITGSNSCTVNVSVPCEDGCTLTPGYWKTHSDLGPAPYDDTWAQLTNGASTPFFLSGQSYYEVLWTPPTGGNAYYILAHAYIAAELNFLNGADPTTAQAAFDAATALFNAYTPSEIAEAKGKVGKDLRDQFISQATVLDNYNNGYIGPGHCSEEVAPAGRIAFGGNNFEDLTDETEISGLVAQSYPNPFDSRTIIRFAVPYKTEVTIEVFNIMGERLTTLMQAPVKGGQWYETEFDASRFQGELFIYRLNTSREVLTGKLLRVK